jgi:hypothetical protein
MVAAARRGNDRLWQCLIQGRAAATSGFTTKLTPPPFFLRNVDNDADADACAAGGAARHVALRILF